MHIGVAGDSTPLDGRAGRGSRWGSRTSPVPTGTSRSTVRSTSTAGASAARSRSGRARPPAARRRRRRRDLGVRRADRRAGAPRAGSMPAAEEVDCIVIADADDRGDRCRWLRGAGRGLRAGRRRPSGSRVVLRAGRRPTSRRRCTCGSTATTSSDRSPPRPDVSAGGMRQSTGSRPAATSASLARENGRLPKNPLCADSGDGCADSMISWRDRVDQRLLPARRRAPQDEHDPLGLGAHRADHLVGERLPPLALVRGGLAAAHGQGRVEEQHALRRPGFEAPVVGRIDPEVGVELLQDVLQRRRRRHPGPHREAETVGLAGAVVRVLARG